MSVCCKATSHRHSSFRMRKDGDMKIKRAFVSLKSAAALALAGVFAVFAAQADDSVFSSLWGHVTNVTSKVGDGISMVGEGIRKDIAQIKEYAKGAESRGEEGKDPADSKEDESTHDADQEIKCATPDDQNHQPSSAAANEKSANDGVSEKADSPTMPEPNELDYALYGVKSVKRGIAVDRSAAERQREVVRKELERLRGFGLFDQPKWVLKGQSIIDSAKAGKDKDVEKAISAYSGYDMMQALRSHSDYDSNFTVRTEKRKSSLCSYAEFVAKYRSVDSLLAPGLAGMASAFIDGDVGDSFRSDFSIWLEQEGLPRVRSLEYLVAMTEVSDATPDQKRQLAKFIASAKTLSSLFDADGYAVSRSRGAGAEREKEYAAQAKVCLSHYLAVRSALPPSSSDAALSSSYREYSVSFAPLAEDGIGNRRNDVQGQIEMDIDTAGHGSDDFSRCPEMTSKVWYPLPVRVGFPMAKICGFEFGRTRADIEPDAGSVVFRYVNGAHSFHVYRMAKSFGRFTHAVARYAYPRNPNTDSIRDEEVEALSCIRLEGFIPESYSKDSVLEELAQKKRLIERKFGIDLGPGSEEGDWYCSELGGRSHVAMGVMRNPKFKSGYRIYLVINYQTGGELPFRAAKECSLWQSRLRAARVKAAESEKKKLTVDENDGADVL